MSTHKHIDLVCVIVMIAALLTTVLFMNGSALGLTAIVDEDAESYTGDANFTSNDLDGSWSTDDATVITLSDDEIHISGSGAYTLNGSVYITNGGKYVLSGTLSDGSIVVDAYASSKVFLMLSGCSVTKSDDAALRVNQADKVFLTLGEGTENFLESGEVYSEEALSDNAGGTIFSHDDLTINGSGSLTVTANYKHGIDANDDLVITGGTIAITAPEDAIHVNERFNFTAADLTITAGDDGIHADASILIADGTVFIKECYEGLEALTIDISGGETTIYSSDDGLNANGGSSDFGMGGGGFGGGMQGGGRMPGNMNGEASTENGDFPGEMPEMDSEFEERMRERGSEMEERFGEMDSEFEFGGQMPEMGSEFEERVREETTEATVGSDTTSEETWIHISGGKVTVINENSQDADGLDSNGDIVITGGEIRVSLSGNGSNSAIDYGSESGGVCEISGGTVVACGSYSMAEAFDSTSTQCSILYNFSDGADPGTTVSLLDADGNELLSYTAVAGFTSVNLSCPELTVGETYTVVIGDNEEEITLSDVSASYGDATSSGFGGNHNMGGMQPKGGHRA